MLDYLDELEAEAIYILREVAGQFEKPALLFSGGTARAFYGRVKLWLDRIMGGVLGLLGVRLLAAEV